MLLKFKRKETKDDDLIDFNKKTHELKFKFKTS